MQIRSSFLFLCVCLSFFFALCLSDEVATQGTPQSNPQENQQLNSLSESPDADTTYIFSDVKEEEGFYPGSISHIVLGFKNVGERPIGFTGIAGSLYYSLDPSYVLENYTAIKYDTTIHPGSEYSFTYPFRLHPMLNEGDYGLRFTALYRDEFNTYASLFYNETITVLEPHRELHLQDILQFGLIIGVFGLLIFVVIKFIGGNRKQKFSNKALSSDKESEWLKGTAVEKHHAKKKQN